MQVKVPQQDPTDSNPPQINKNFEEEIENEIDALDNLQNIDVPSSATEYRLRGASGASAGSHSSTTTNFLFKDSSNQNPPREPNYHQNTSKYAVFSQTKNEINL